MCSGSIPLKSTKQQEAEGWELWSEAGCIFNHESLNFEFSCENGIATIAKMEFNVSSVIFIGTIKNRSELRKIMKQIGITK